MNFQDVYETELFDTDDLTLEDMILFGRVAFENMNFKQFHKWFQRAKLQDEDIKKEYETKTKTEDFIIKLINDGGPDILARMSSQVSSIPTDVLEGLKVRES